MGLITNAFLMSRNRRFNERKSLNPEVLNHYSGIIPWKLAIYFSGFSSSFSTNSLFLSAISLRSTSVFSSAVIRILFACSWETTNSLSFKCRTLEKRLKDFWIIKKLRNVIDRTMSRIISILIATRNFLRWANKQLIEMLQGRWLSWWIAGKQMLQIYQRNFRPLNKGFSFSSYDWRMICMLFQLLCPKVTLHFIRLMLAKYFVPLLI